MNGRMGTIAVLMSLMAGTAIHAQARDDEIIRSVAAYTLHGFVREVRYQCDLGRPTRAYTIWRKSHRDYLIYPGGWLMEDIVNVAFDGALEAGEFIAEFGCEEAEAEARSFFVYAPFRPREPQAPKFEAEGEPKARQEADLLYYDGLFDFTKTD